MKFQIGCKGTIFYAHSQTKCTKTDSMCTKHGFCAIIVPYGELYCRLCPSLWEINYFLHLKLA